MSNQRGLVQRIERKLENTVGDAVARVFGGSIVPQEVEALLRREASDGVQTLQGGRLLAPNEYVITLSESDFEKVSADRDLTSDTFAKHLGGYLREQGWQTYGDVVVRFEQSPNLHTGQYRARGVVNPDASPHPTAGARDYDYGRAPGRHEEPGYGRPEPRPSYPDQGGYEQQQGYGGGYGRQDYAQPDYPRYEQGGYGEQGRDYDYGQPAGGGYGGYGQAQGEYPGAGHNVTLQLDDGSGRTYQLREGANVIGRGQDAQFRLPDTGVSRRHLEIRWDGQVALLSDLNSTNGTTVNNAPVQEWQLADGDVIRLGHSEIIVRVH